MTLKNFTKKVRIAATKTVETLKEVAPWFGIGATVGVAVGMLENIKRLNGRVNDLEDAINNLGDVVNNNADASMNLTDVVNNNANILIRDHERIDTLEKRQALLMEQALQKSEGKTEE